MENCTSSVKCVQLVYHMNCFRFSTKVPFAFMTGRSWNSLMWNPPFARPDKVTYQLNRILYTLDGENETKIFRINEEFFNQLDWNYAFVSDLKMLEIYETSGKTPSSSGSCDSTKRRNRGSINPRREKCGSLFSAKSSRSATEYQAETASQRTSVEYAALKHWQVRSPTWHQ